MEKKTISLDDVYFFVEVAKRGNFSATAQVLNVPTATLSRRISELEKGLGYAVFQRTTRKVSLTALGERYFQECIGQVEGLLNAHERVQTYLESPEGTLRVSIMPGLAPVLPGVVDELHKRFPRLSFEFDLGSTSKEAGLTGFDLHVRAGRQEDSNLIQKPLINLQRMLMASTSYLKERGRPKKPADLEAHDQIGAHIETTWELSRGDEIEVVKLTPKYISNSTMLSLQLASRGLGITQTPMQFGQRIMADFKLERVLPDWEVSSTMLYALFESRVISARATAFINVLKDHLRTHLTTGEEGPSVFVS
ncbi:LysR family transcriptional regulator [Achromobacter xylosoxidans]|uniref:LysR family transcriptional regulator n=1 Tax=Alcaligenes xylosoxydans xylosoxydans TaxID=85698 RepID=UPI001562C873|nr:LysR family transcriptional regulator [Achromobacter xylosoxidans]